jgi:hypothetical protein
MALFYSAAIASLPQILSERRSAASLVRNLPLLSTRRPIVVVERELPSLTFYLDRTPEKLSAEGLEARLGREDGALFVLDETDLPSLPAESRARLRDVGSAGRLHVFEEAPSSSDGGTGPQPGSESP